MRTLALIALLLPLIGVSAPATRPIRWVLEARLAEAGPVGPTTQPTTPGAPLLAAGAKILSSIEVSVVDREPFSASTTIGDRRIHLSGQARSMDGQTSRARIEFEFADQTSIPPSISGFSIKSQIIVTVDEPFPTGVCQSEGRPDFGLVLTLKSRQN